MHQTLNATMLQVSVDSRGARSASSVLATPMHCGDAQPLRSSLVLSFCLFCFSQVRTQTLVKNAVIQVDANPFKQWYQQHYGTEIGAKKRSAAAQAAAAETAVEEKKASNHVKRKLAVREALLFVTAAVSRLCSRQHCACNLALLPACHLMTQRICSSCEGNSQRCNPNAHMRGCSACRGGPRGT